MKTTDLRQYFGTVTEIARRLNCSRETIYAWERAGGDVPELYQYRAQEATAGALRADPPPIPPRPPEGR